MSPALPEEHELEDSDDLESGDEGIASGILAQRLEQLRDESWMKPALESALAQLAPAKRAVAGYDIEYCKIKPNRDINVVFRVRRLGSGGAEMAPERLSCTVFPSAEACRLRYAEDERIPLAESTRRRIAAAGYERHAAWIDDPAMIVRVFPSDPGLPGLAPATDPEEMKPIFARHLEPCRRAGSAPCGFTCEILHYKPRRSCTLHYTIDPGDLGDLGDRRRSGGDGPAPCRVYGKVARDDRGARNYRTLTAAWEASLASNGSWRAARPVAYLPRWQLLLQEAVPGRDFRLVFGELTPDDADEAQLEQARRHLEGIASAVRGLQTAPIGPGPVKTFERLRAEQEKNLSYMDALQPRLAAEIAGIRRELERLEPETPAGPLVFSHGDFAHGNVLIDGERVGIIDFDKAGAAEPAYDVAYFLTHMWSFGIRHPRRMPHVTRLWKHLRNFYLELAPEVSSERLSLYEALDFSAYVLRNFRKQSHQENWLAWAEGQVSAAWDRLAVVAGKRGGVP